MRWLVAPVALVVIFLDLTFLMLLTQGFGAFFVVVSQSVSGVFGLWLLRTRDLNLLFFMAIERGKGERIVDELLEDGLLILGGLCLILPGFLTDLGGVLVWASGTRPQVFGFAKQLFRGFTGE